MKTLLVLIGCCLLFSACVRNNPKPVWLKIGTWTLSHNPYLATQPETLIHNFSDAWVSADNKVTGIFETAAKSRRGIPVSSRKHTAATVMTIINVNLR